MAKKTRKSKVEKKANWKLEEAQEKSRPTSKDKSLFFSQIHAYVVGLTDFLYQRDGEIIAFARPDLAVSGTGSSSVAPAVDSRAMSTA